MKSLIGQDDYRFSVLMSVYSKDEPLFLDAALKSIRTQTVLADEIVLVKDGKLTDDLEKILSRYDSEFEGRLKIVPLKENGGLGHALNIGLEHCSYELVARMDADDISISDRFEKQLNVFRKDKNISVTSGNISEFDKMPGDLKVFRKLPETHDEILKFSKSRCPVNHPCVMFKKKDILAVGSYIIMASFEDYYLWVRLLHAGYKFYNLPDVLLHFRTGNNMIGRRSGWTYLRREKAFLSNMHSIGFINFKEYILLAVTRLPLRILPKKLLIFLYSKFLR
jgi:glycosyltransferase involved in cell wall biosynthesis